MTAKAIITHRKTDVPLIDLPTGRVITFPSREVAERWIQLRGCEDTLHVVGMIACDRSVVQEIRKIRSKEAVCDCDYDAKKQNRGSWYKPYKTRSGHRTECPVEKARWA